MPRYFFNIRRRHLSVCDLRGEECSGPAEAVHRAAVEALALVIRRSRVRDWTDWAVDIEDEARNRLATVPVGFVLGSSNEDPVATVRRNGGADRSGPRWAHAPAHRRRQDDGRKDRR